MKRPSIVAAMLLWLFAVAPLFAREVRITILHTCDLHGNVLPGSDYDGTTNLGGIARCATAIAQVRAQEKNVLLVDAGDTIQGTPVSLLSGGLVMVKALNALRYDAWIWGNHEFDWGEEKLAACAENATMPILVANLGADPSTALTAPNLSKRVLAPVKPFLIRTVDGVKVGIIGLTTPGIPNWSRPHLIAGLQFADSVATLKQIVPAARAAGAQVLVLVCHQGYKEGGDDHANQINAIAQNFPELDLIIGGHTHRLFPEFKLNGIMYCQDGYFGINLGRVELVFDTELGRVVERHAHAERMDDRVAIDAKMVKLCGKELDAAEKLSRTVIGEAMAEFWLRGAPHKETPIQDLIDEAIADALKKRDVKLDAIVHGVLDRKATLAAGPITIADVWKVVPYENTIGVAQLTPAELREILDENAGMYRGFSFRGVWGLKWTFDPAAAAGHRVLLLRRADGSALPEDQRLAVAFNSFDLASGGTRWKKLRELVDRPAAKLVEYDFQTRDCVVDWIRAHRRISPTVAGWWQVKKSE